MTKQMTLTIALLTLLFGGIFAFLQGKQYLIDQYLADYQPPPVTIPAEPVLVERWDSYLKSIGTLKAVNGVEITSEIGGLIKEIFFTSGIEVKKNQRLVQLDDSVEQANLRSNAAQLKLAQINHRRDKKLLTSRAISKTDFDTVEAKLVDAEAQVEKTKALIEQKRIYAPFDGRIGIRLVNVGDFVSTGDQLVTLQAIDSLHVDFSVPEQFFPLLYPDQLVRFTVKAFANRVFEAKVTAVNSKVDQNTRNILVRAIFDNSAKELVPGMFANVNIILAQQQEVVTVPQTAISYSLYGDSVFVVTSNGVDQEGNALHTVQRRYIKVSHRRSERVAIADGLAEGEIVVTAGQLKLDNDTRVLIDNPTFSK